MLIAIDGSNCSLRAIEYAGRQFSGVSDLKITLLHVLPYPPAPLWDEGHIPTKKEKADREREIDSWLMDQLARTEPLFDKELAILVEACTSRTQLTTKTISDSSDIQTAFLKRPRKADIRLLSSADAVSQL